LIEDDRHKTPDIILDGKIKYEMKAPDGKSIRAIERNVKRAGAKCQNVIIDACRIRRVQDRSIKNYLLSHIKDWPKIKKLMFIGRDGKAVDIK
jgi:hypothetical protein